ncbi:cellulose biosynthesis protein BcsG [Rahnella inusitata]|uniref:Cellulose biosynthesis protein BcsG n=1 Tax=Rahnella inusitata TaxID=58169 RepID=A0ABX9NZZ6_9GAMM|nr:cellulose biosynthesis protein BcsG [Rahnella inusitata]QUT13598.1 cellulose biosynthesis protein BcsG [Rahnella inusitata]RJT12297.1 cellulose biosynthesis protein BcsG [Rahnella inusitata]
MKASQPSAPRLRVWQSWRGLGAWNYYFLLKFVLLWQGYLNFDALSNLIFAAVLLFPLPSLRVHRWRQWIALPFGLALLYHDTWLPGWRSIVSQGADVTGFSMGYLLELADRFINWQWIGVGFALLVGYLFVSQWIRLTTFTVAALLWVNLSFLVTPFFASKPVTAAVQPTVTAQPVAASGTDNKVNGPPTDANLSAYLEQFYQNESRRTVRFPDALPADAQPFDLLVINICSLAWADLDAVNLSTSPLWSRFDYVFSNFNSATAYSGPASIRLLRASCGQPSHHNLYQSAGQQCYLFDDLARLGFTSQLAMDHTGEFGNYIGNLRDDADMKSPLMSQAGLGHELTSFDGSPIFNDGQLFTRWLENQEKAGTARTATFFNLIPLHDGNRYVGSNKSADYRSRATTLLNNLNTFMDQLEKSGRKVMLVVVPEHGAALVGDKMQISGLRDIPSPGITHIPVGVKFFGMQAPHSASPMKIDAPSSYLAIAEMVSRAVDGKVFTSPSMDWKTFSANLPQTPLVSENENAVVMEYQGKVYIRLNGGGWVPYPS